MKKFTLDLGEKGQFEVHAASLDAVEGWEKGLPDLWSKNLDKVVEEDMTAEIAQLEALETLAVQRLTDIEYIFENFEVVKALIEAEKAKA